VNATRARGCRGDTDPVPATAQGLPGTGPISPGRPADRPQPVGGGPARRKVKGKSTLAAGRAGLAVDADMVLSVSQSLALAEACVTEGAWGGVVECFVLVMALCGLRPGRRPGW
jgi:hypothetical protein